MSDLKTPGVYIVEKNAFPNSVVEVATAVPAFVGYTEKAASKGASLLGRPFRIDLLAEFELYFGLGPPAAFDIRAPRDGEAADVQAPDGAAYVIDLTCERFRLYDAMRHFFQNGGGPCWIVSVGDYRGAVELGPLQSGLTALEREQEPTLVVIPDAVELAAGDCIALQQQMLRHCAVDMRNRFAILDVHGATGGPVQGDPAVEAFRATMGADNLAYGAAYYPFVHTRLRTEADLSYLDFPGVRFSQLLTDLPPRFAEVAKQADRTDADWRAAFEKAKAAHPALKDEAAWIAAAQAQTHQALVQGSAVFQAILKAATRKLNLMPPSAALAGLYTLVDNTRGVWKAPANVSIANVVEPAVAISHADQESLNVDAQGKSINAIRAFVGEGVLVWGARTLDGNSLDWRYINVRRTMIMLEESCRLAVKALVFEPNAAATWITVKSMLQNFLTGIWRRGGLAGQTPDDAFSVHCGLGETMTHADIADGVLRVTVLVALSRPAEFIEITFQQAMAKP